MKVVRIHAYGGPEAMRYEDAPDSLPGAGEIVVDVEASGVNPVDCIFRAGLLSERLPKMMPLILGQDVAGRVSAVGAGVTGFVRGDRVFGMMPPRWGNGGYTERVAGRAEWFAAIPEALDTISAAALPTPASTAIQQIEDDLDIQPGRHVLVSGATGACGMVLCYVARRRGAHVTAAVRRAYRDRVRHADAILVLDEPLLAVAGRFDCIADAIGGETAFRLLATLRPGGVLSTIAADPIPDARSLDVTVRHVSVKADTPRLGQLAQEMAAGAIERPVVTTMAMKDAAEAHRRLEAGGAGKIVLVNAR